MYNFYKVKKGNLILKHIWLLGMEENIAEGSTCQDLVSRNA